MSYETLNLFLHILVFFMGAGIGSFLNVVIYRLPLGMSVNKPVRSFCPSCKKQIPFYRNIPLFSWLALRGKCADCGSPISVRYFLVELLVGVLFYAIFLSFAGPWNQISQWGPIVLAYWVFFALLVSGTFIDLEHFILPHEITIGGAVTGVLFAFWAPAIVGQEGHQMGVLVSFLSAFLGLGLLWSVVELGKMMFGRLNLKFDSAEKFSIFEPNADDPPVLRCQGDDLSWQDIFTRDSDRLIITCSKLQVEERSWSNVIAEVKMETITVKSDPKAKTGDSIPLADVKRIDGECSHITIPREAMGFGDVLFIAMIGAFTGWKGVLFTVFAASIIGTIFAVFPRLIGKQDWASRIPFGPYLAAGAGLFVFWGPQWIDWYLNRFRL
ncbi:MAG: prepilin peptidase [Verrucomicrobiaceae bacterium]|nr:prepilin peptidase [Verrucomicrobiaceae bacterium]